MNLDPNDPKLTAYALGELDAAARSEVEAELERDPANRQRVEQVRETAALLTNALAKEPSPVNSDNHRPAIEAELQSRPRTRVRPWVRWALAATVLLVVGFHTWSYVRAWRGEGQLLLADKDAGRPTFEPHPASQEGMRYEEDTEGDDGQRTFFPALDKVGNYAFRADGPRSSESSPSADPKPWGNRDGKDGTRNTVVSKEGAVGGKLGDKRALGPGTLVSNRDLPSSTAEPEMAGKKEKLIAPPNNEQGKERWQHVTARLEALEAKTGRDGTARDRELGQVLREAAESPLAPGHNTEAYDRVVDNPFMVVSQNPLSTFSIDVDTASYANMRRFLNQGSLPPKDAVRIEELINYFTYQYPQPQGEAPFSVNLEVADCPWNGEHRLVRVGLKGRNISDEQRPPTNLVFLIDVSGSMQPPNRLPLVKQALRLLVEKLTENDRVSIVVYAADCGIKLPSTSADNKETILSVIERLQAGGSTNGGSGIELAYQQAVANFIPGGVNRVILSTDGDFNVGVTNQGDLTRLIEDKAKSGVFLSVLGFGMGNLKDSTMEKLADKGNGNYAYIDTLAEARKVLVEQMNGTLVTIAKDVKIQIEFNPAQVGAYRLIGYENRMLRKEDFNDDKKDAGEIGAGHTVTALYEIVPGGKPVNVPGVDPLKYQKPSQPAAADTASRDLMTVKLRYKAPDGDTSKLLEYPVADSGRRFGQASGDFKWAAAVAAFGMILRDSEHKGSATLDAVLELAEDGKGPDLEGYRTEFIRLVRLAKAIH